MDLCYYSFGLVVKVQQEKTLSKDVFYQSVGDFKIMAGKTEKVTIGRIENDVEKWIFLPIFIEIWRADRSGYVLVKAQNRDDR